MNKKKPLEAVNVMFLGLFNFTLSEISLICLFGIQRKNNLPINFQQFFRTCKDKSEVKV